MSYKDKWDLILSDVRFRPKTGTIEADARNPFENDYGRLISSAPIRRLQDKTQVFPLEQSDFIRTRLTHSLEVSYIGSSIGQSIEEHLIKAREIAGEKRGCLPSLLRVSGLVHDLGNPPFGHFGEEFKQFFNFYFLKIKIFKLIEHCSVYLQRKFFIEKRIIYELLLGYAYKLPYLPTLKYYYKRNGYR